MKNDPNVAHTLAIYNDKNLVRQQTVSREAVKIGSVAEVNPFLAGRAFKVSASDPFEATGTGDDAAEGTYTYSMLEGHAVSPTDVDTHAASAEIRISWGQQLLHVCHLDASASFYAGETIGRKLSCDYFIPASKLGTKRAPLVVAGSAVLLPGAVATITIEDQPAMSAEEAIAQGLATACAEIRGAHRVALVDGMTVKLQLDDMFVEVRGVKKARKLGGAFTMAAVSGGALLYVLASFLGHAGLLAAMAAFMPPLGATADDEMTDDQRYLVKQYLEAAAENENQPAVKELLNEVAAGPSGGTGVAAKGSSGKLGSETSKYVEGRFAVKGDSPQPHIAKAEMMREAADFGIIGLLNNGMGATNEPLAFDAYRSEGADPLSADGNMWGKQVGDAYGPGGLGLTGVGEGGDGLGKGIGLGTVGTVGHGSGYGCPSCMGFGNGNSDGFIRRGHKATSPNPIRQGELNLSGRLPPEVIQRVVRANFGRYRACYQSALKTNPNLQGRVVVSFVIGRNGTVSTAMGGGDLPSQAVIGCVAGAFRSLTFPQPEHGIVTITYPLVFSPAS